MKIAKKQEIKDCIKYGVLGLVVIFDYFQLDINSRTLILFMCLIAFCLSAFLEKKIKASSNYMCDIILELEKRISAETKYWCILAKDIYPAKDEKLLSPEFDSFFRDVTKTTLTRGFSLPFPPYPGLAVVDGDFRSGRIENVTWNELNKSFICKVLPIKMTDEHILENVILSCVDNEGWELQTGDFLTMVALKKLRKKQDEDEEIEKTECGTAEGK